MDKHTLIIVILSALLSVSEALASVPKIKANSIYQLLSQLLDSVVYILTKNK